MRQRVAERDGAQAKGRIRSNGGNGGGDIGGGGALNGRAGASESFVERSRGGRMVSPGERGEQELHDLEQRWPRSVEPPSTQIPDAETYSY